MRDFGEVEKLQVSVKGPANFVTAADRKAEQTLRDELMTARPGYCFVGEEGRPDRRPRQDPHLVCRPAGRHHQFLHGIPQFAISIGLEREGTMIAGVVYNPVSDEMFIAERGKGAFLNDQRIRVAGRRSLQDAVVACGLPHRGRGDLALFRTEFVAVQEQVAGFAGSDRRRSISPSSPPGASIFIGSATFRHGTWRRGF